MTTDLHQPGAKDDAGKQRPALVLGAFWPAIIAQARTTTEPSLAPCPFTGLLDAVACDDPLRAVGVALTLFFQHEGAGLSKFLVRNRSALNAVTEVGTFGACKYSPDGWLRVPDGIHRYKDALVRHLMAFLGDEAVDAESKMPHEWHIMWNALAWHTLVILAEVRAENAAFREGK
jgi:hypothetical protein